MFKEIKAEFMSFLKDDVIEKIAHAVTPNIAKPMELIFGIKYQDIDRIYLSDLGKVNKLVVLYDCHDDKHQIEYDTVPIDGKIHIVILIPTYLLNKDESNAINFTNAVVRYVSLNTLLISIQYEAYSRDIKTTLDMVLLQSTQVISASIIKEVYSGYNLSKLIYDAVINFIGLFKDKYTETGIKSILSLFDEGLDIEQLLDNGYICCIKPDDENYPGIWFNSQETKEEEKHD